MNYTWVSLLFLFLKCIIYWLILVHSTLYHSNLLPDVFVNYSTLNSSVHTYLTRTYSDIHIHRAYTSFGQRSRDTRPRRLGLEWYKCLVSGTQRLGQICQSLSLEKIGLGLGLSLETRPGILAYFVFCLIIVIPINAISSQSHMIDPRMAAYTRPFSTRQRH